MYPVIEIGSYSVSTFAVAVAIACLVGATLGTLQARHVGVDPNIVWRFIPFAVVGGLIGGKAYQAALNLLDGEPVLSPFVSTGGLVYYGAITGGVAVAWAFVRREGHPSHLLFDYGAPCVAFAHAIGRIGCLMVGDDYGLPSTLPWAMAFPNGAPPSTADNLRRAGANVPEGLSTDTVLRVHPTQLYEAIALCVFGFILWRATRRQFRPWTVFGAYACMYGMWRFLNEFLRVKDDHIEAIGITSAQVISLMVVAMGITLIVRARRTF